VKLGTGDLYTIPFSNSNCSENVGAMKAIIYLEA